MRFPMEVQSNSVYSVHSFKSKDMLIFIKSWITPPQDSPSKESLVEVQKLIKKCLIYLDWILKCSTFASAKQESWFLIDRFIIIGY